MSDKIIQLNEGVIKQELGEMVRVRIPAKLNRGSEAVPSRIFRTFVAW